MDVKWIDACLDRAIQLGPPTSIILATCVSEDDKPNIITLGMYMPISSDPPLIVIGVSPKRYSHQIIVQTGEFVVNVPTKEILEQTIFCGTVSGREHDKFVETELHPIPASKVKPPLIDECVSSLECKVVADHIFGDHTLFVGKVLAAHVKEGMLNETLNVLKAQTISRKGSYYFVPKPFHKVQEQKHGLSDPKFNKKA